MIKTLTSNKLPLTSIILVSSLVCWSSFSYIPTLAGLEYWLADLRLLLVSKSPKQTQAGDIVIMSITESTLSKLAYRSPLDRKMLSRLILSLEQKGAKAIALDILLDQPTEPEKDQLFRTTLKNSSIPITVAWITPEQEKKYMTSQQSTWFHQLQADTGIHPGIVSLTGTDAYGVVRWMHPGTPIDNGYRYSFPSTIASSLNLDPFRSAETILYQPPDNDQQPVFPIYETRPDILKFYPPAKWIKDKIILIGAIRPFEDRHVTPLNAWTSGQTDKLPGMLIHAYALAQIIAQKKAIFFTIATGIPATLLMAMIGILLALVEIRLWLKAILSIVLLGSYYALNLLVYRYLQILLPLLAPSLAFLMTWSLQASWLGRQYRKQKRFIKTAFSHYLAPDMVNKLIKQPEQLKVGGETKEVTFLFSDIAGFTTLSESLDPAALGRLINSYLDGMVAIIFKHKGTLDKFIGDAVVCFFGAPEPQQDHAQRAVACALDMDAFTREFEQQQQQAGIDFGITRIGLHSGKASVGNFGATNNFNYTALGDTVNTAARLEGANKFLGTRICISEATANQTSGIRIRHSADLILKGKTEATGTCQPLRPDADEIFYLERYNEAIEAIKAGKIETAKTSFAKLYEEYPNDPLVNLHLTRLNRGETSTNVTMESK